MAIDIWNQPAESSLSERQQLSHNAKSAAESGGWGSPGMSGPLGPPVVTSSTDNREKEKCAIQNT